MLRLTEIKLPLDHPEEALRAAICQRLGIAEDELFSHSVFRRGVDARKKTAITLIYAVDVQIRHETEALARLRGERNVMPTPDTSYRFVAQAPAGWSARPVVIGTGPCGLFAGADPGADGLPPDHARARQGRARAHQGHLGPVAPGRARPGVERAVRRGRRRHLLRRQAVQPDQGPAPPRPQGARPSSSRPARRPRSSTSASRTSAPSGWSAWSRRCAPSIESLGGEVRFGSRVDGHRHRARCRRQRPGARRACSPTASASPPITSCWRSATARATPSRCCTSAASTSRPSRSRSACASSIRSR